MKLNLTTDQVLTTTRSVRKRLDFDKPVERSIVEECLELALQAPTGSNSQGWHFIVVEDAAKKKALADIYMENFKLYASMPRPKRLRAMATLPGNSSYTSSTSSMGVLALTM